MSGGYGELGPILLTGKLLWNPIVSNTIPGSFQLIQKCIIRQISYACAMKNVYCRVLLPKGNDQISSIAIDSWIWWWWLLTKSGNPAGNPAGSSTFRNHVEWSFKWCPLLQKSGEKKNEARAHSATSPLPPGTGRSSMMFAIVPKQGSKYPVDPRMCGWFIATTFFAKIVV